MFVSSFSLGGRIYLHWFISNTRRAHLKDCFEILKKQVPNLEEKKTSNLNILRGALKHIQVKACFGF
jgi:MAX-binding protein